MYQKDNCTTEILRRCLTDILRKLSQTESDECAKLCPIECDSIIYSITPQYIKYIPSEKMSIWWRNKLSNAVSL